jgi:catalase
VDKVRGRPEKFAEHYAQAKLFFESQTEAEKAHIRGAFRFELSKLTVPAIRVRVISSLLNVSKELAGALAKDLGIELPKPMPRATKNAPEAEINTSPALSLTALPGNGGIATRKVAIVLADGVDADPITNLIDALDGAGAVTRLLGSRLGTVRSEDGEPLEIDATLENSPSVLFDALVLPGGAEAVEGLCLDGRMLEFVKDQYRHCKTILALGDSSKILTKAGIALTLPSGDVDPGLLIDGQEGNEANAQSFIAAIGRHRHIERDRDPPLI